MITESVLGNIEANYKIIILLYMMTGQWLCEQMYTLETHTEVCGGVEREGVTLSGICFRQFLKNKVIDETDMENFFII